MHQCTKGLYMNVSSLKEKEKLKMHLAAYIRLFRKLHVSPFFFFFLTSNGVQNNSGATYYLWSSINWMSLLFSQSDGSCRGTSHCNISCVGISHDMLHDTLILSIQLVLCDLVQGTYTKYFGDRVFIFLCVSILQRSSKVRLIYLATGWKRTQSPVNDSLLPVQTGCDENQNVMN